MAFVETCSNQLFLIKLLKKQNKKNKTGYLWDVFKDFLFRIVSSVLCFLSDRCQPVTVSIPLRLPPFANLGVTSCETVDIVFYSLRLHACWLKPTASRIPWATVLALCVRPWPLTYLWRRSSKRGSLLRDHIQHSINSSLAFIVYCTHSAQVFLS